MLVSALSRVEIDADNTQLQSVPSDSPFWNERSAIKEPIRTAIGAQDPPPTSVLREQVYATEPSVGCFLEALSNLLQDLGGASGGTRQERSQGLQRQCKVHLLGSEPREPLLGSEPQFIEVGRGVRTP